MSLKKQYLKTKSKCKVTFRLEKEAAETAETVHLVGDFNGWGLGATPMKKRKDGSSSITLDLEIGKKYHYRYVLDQSVWENDWAADEYEPSPYPGVENSVVIV